MKLAFAASLTLANGMCGFAALIVLAHWPLASALPMAAALIFAAWAFDMVDGIAARQLGVAGPFGAALDSLCDTVTFGLVPGCALGVMTAPMMAVWAWAGSGVGAAFLGCAIVRLARFTVAATEAPPSRPAPRYRLFEGLSVPGAAMAMAACVLTVPLAGLGVAAIASGLMVSRIPYPDLGHIYLTRRLPPWHLIAPLALTVAVGPMTALAVGFGLYLALGPFLGVLLRRRMAGT